MAFNPSPKVQVARDAAKALDAEQVVIVFVNGDQFGYASYGKTARLCAETRKLADVLFETTAEHFSKEASDA